ncbi:MAG TPA: amidohydrolase family protein, partial [Methanomassiliicoccales archaeon]|nr:amidohydrolase family protein [Methanomassiliicoccales archaeon]
MDVVIEGRALFNGRLEQCCIGINDGKVAAVKRALKGERHFDFGDKILLPGGIDPHVHFRDPGMTQKEDFSSGSLAALYGGVTCAFDMPNTLPATVTLDALREKHSIASRRSYIDFGLFAGVTPTSDIKSIAAEAVGFKMFMGSSTASALVTEDADLGRIMPLIAQTGKPLSVHAEDERSIEKGPVKTLNDHANNRPPRAEVNAIKRLLAISGDVKINICHVSSQEGLNVLTGTPYFKEVATHHMFLDAGMDLGGLGKVNPPLRTREDREALLKAFIQGRFEMLGSDHAPHTLDEKSQDMGAAPSGVPG